ERATLIVWQRLQRLGADRLPLEVATAWRKLAMVYEFDSLRLEQRLHEAVEVLATRGIEVMLLKGSTLAYTTYGSFADRPMGDVDLLVRPEQAREAWLALQTRGWSWPAAQWPAERYSRHQHLPPLVDAQARSRPRRRASSGRRASSSAPAPPSVPPRQVRASLCLSALPNGASLPIRQAGPPTVGSRHGSRLERARVGPPVADRVDR